MNRIVTCHDLIPLRFADRYLNWKDGGVRVRRARDARRFCEATHVIAISAETGNDLRALLHVDPAKVTVVYNGIDLGRWSPKRRESDRRVRTAAAYSQSAKAARWMAAATFSWPRSFQ